MCQIILQCRRYSLVANLSCDNGKCYITISEFKNWLYKYAETSYHHYSGGTILSGLCFFLFGFLFTE
jgi:hypothetical protein